MVKSQVHALLLVVRGLLKDIRVSYPAIEGLDLDYERLALYCQTRGLTVFTLDLPNLDTLLCKALETGRLQLSGPFSRRVSRRVKVPRLFSGLWLRLFDRDAYLRQDLDETILAFLRQLCCIGKKIEVACSPERVQIALENYHVIERETREPTLQWHHDTLDVGRKWDGLALHDLLPPVGSVHDLFGFCRDPVGQCTSQHDRHLLDRIQIVADLIIGAFDFFDPVAYSGDLESECRGIGFRHGPGVVAERKKQHEKSCFSNWPQKLQHRFPFEFCGTTAGSDVERPLNHEVASRLMCVPKTAKGPRFIACEPSSHLWCQFIVLSFLLDQMKKTLLGSFIDLKDQGKSQALVLRASLDRKLATVDLSDASDRLSCWTVERIFRRSSSVLFALHAARTRHLRDEVSSEKGFLRLKKFATQGTATTFPVQSIVFLCLALGACIKGKPTISKIRRLVGQVRVYGDDIIIPSRGYEQLVRAMELLGLKVNMAKSYVSGHFRESCGVDGYKGYDVTPIKPKTLVANSPASRQAVVDISNNLFLKGYWYASDSLIALLPPRLRRGVRVVAQRHAGFSGLASYSESDESHLTTRWNSRLHRYEVRVWGLSPRTPKRPRDGWDVLLDFMSSEHHHELARMVSQYGDTRKARDGFRWEPQNAASRVHASQPRQAWRQSMDRRWEPSRFVLPTVGGCPLLRAPSA